MKGRFDLLRFSSGGRRERRESRICFSARQGYACLAAIKPFVATFAAGNEVCPSFLYIFLEFPINFLICK